MSVEFESPVILTLNAVRDTLSHLCIRGIKHANPDSIKTLRDAASFFRQSDATHFADHIEKFLSSCEDNPQSTPRLLLELQSRVILFERETSRQKAIDILS